MSFPQEYQTNYGSGNDYDFGFDGLSVIALCLTRWGLITLVIPACLVRATNISQIPSPSNLSRRAKPMNRGSVWEHRSN